MRFSELADVLRGINGVTNLKEESTDIDDIDDSYSFGTLEFSSVSYTYLINKKNSVKLITISNSFEYDTLGLYTDSRLFNMVNNFNSTYMGFKAFILDRRKSNESMTLKTSKINTMAVAFNTEFLFPIELDLNRAEIKKSLLICLDTLGQAPALLSEMMFEYGIKHKNISSGNM